MCQICIFNYLLNGHLFFRYVYLGAPMKLQLIDAIVKGIFVGLFMAISVGPTLFAVIKYSMDNSYKAGLAFVLGVSVSDIIYVVIANLAATWLEVLGTYRAYIAIGGSTILIMVGFAGLVRKIKPQMPNSGPVAISGAHYIKIWASGFLINTVNPGVILSWLTAVTATANSDGTYRFVLFGTCLSLILCIDFLKIFLAEKIKILLTPKRLVQVRHLSSLILLILGLMLLVKTIFY